MSKPRTLSEKIVFSPRTVTDTLYEDNLLKEVTIKRGDYDSVVYGDVRFNNSTFQNGKFRDCKFSGVMFSNCVFQGAVLDNCDITGLVINGVNVSDAITKYRGESPAESPES